ncbi:MAG: hypothetical protein ACI4SH_01070 [Candidatus Scatosoma sp.]
MRKNGESGDGAEKSGKTNRYRRTAARRAEKKSAAEQAEDKRTGGKQWRVRVAGEKDDERT